MGKYLDVEGLDTYREGKYAHYVKPTDIKYISQDDFSIASADEKIADGDWDLDLSLFEDTSSLYKAYKDVFFNGKNWNDTEFYKGDGSLGMLRLNTTIDDTNKRICRLARCQYLNYIFKAMRQFGYVQDPYTNFMGVNIGRNGEVIINNGRHRLAAAKLLKISNIPVVIDVRHREWVGFRESVLAYASRHGGRVYAPLKHIDLQDIPARQDDKRTSDVLSTINAESRTVLDLGANWGMMCQALEDAGRKCVAVEHSPEEIAFARKFKNIGGYSYEIVQEDICSYVNHSDSFDCILALSIFHHLAKSSEGHAMLIRILSRLKCKEMLFQMPDVEEMKLFPHSYKNYKPDEFVKLILDNSCLNKSKEIGNRETRKMFHLTV